MTKLFEFITVQKEKYEEKLSLYSNFYYQHMIVQQFLQIQLKIYLKTTRHNLFISIA